MELLGHVFCWPRRSRPDFLGMHADLKTADGHQRVVRYGHLPEREVMTGIGPVAVRQPRVRDREADATDPADRHHPSAWV